MSLARPDLLRRLNERRVLDVVRTEGGCSRADITRRTGISAPTVSKVVATLLEAGVIEEFNGVENRIGRPGKLLRLTLGKVQVLGAVLGIGQSRVFAAGLDGSIAADSVQAFDTPQSYEDILACLMTAVGVLRKRTRRTLGLGISLPGLVDEERGRVLFSPNLHATDGRDIGADLATAANLEITVIQESRALCLAERLYGNARDLRDFVVLDVSEGVGAGILLDGRPIIGRNGVAGEFGHMTVNRDGELCGCGNRGCLETVASDRALCAAAGRATGRKLTIDDVVRLAREGEAKVRAAVDQAFEWLAIGLAALINGLNPEAVFLNGRMLDIGPETLVRITELTRARTLAVSMRDCRILQGLGGKDQGAVGAAIESLVTARGPVLG